MSQRVSAVAALMLAAAAARVQPHAASAAGAAVHRDNGDKVGERRNERAMPISLGLGETLDVGEGTGSAVDDRYTPPFRFDGKIQQVTVDLKPN